MAPQPPMSSAPRGGPSDGGLRRGLANRHIQLIALGGAIGTGLFYGSAESISQAGPAVLVCYLLGGAVIFLVMRALGEMSVDRPTSGAFSEYAHQNWGPAAGFVSGWNYWFNYIAVSMAELTVVGKYVQFWAPGVPDWVAAAVLLVLVTAVNLTAVRAYGEIEFWFALVKVVAIVAMIVLGVVVIAAGSGEGSTIGVSNLWRHGGFAPHGLGGIALGMVVVMFSFGGVELVGITAGEAKDPARSIPRAVNQVVVRILVFYIGAVAVILCLVPWDRVGTAGSPFVTIFDRVGIRGAAHLLNAVVLTAAVSAYNSGLYANSRMLHSLARQGQAPAVLARTNRQGSPWVATVVSSAVTTLAVVLTYLFPDTVFLYVISVALVSGIINWTMIVVTDLLFRRRIGRAGVADLAFPMPGNPVTSVLVLVVLAAVVVLMAFIPAYRVALVVGPVWLGILLLGWRLVARRGRAGTQG